MYGVEQLRREGGREGGEGRCVGVHMNVSRGPWHNMLLQYSIGHDTIIVLCSDTYILSSILLRE